MNQTLEARESMQFDVVIIGAGPAGLASAIKMKQLAPEFSICILEKGSEVGAHILSGAVIETKALEELIPDWKEKNAPVTCAAKKDEFLFLSKNYAFKLPTPKTMHNHGNYIISLANLCRFLATEASNLGVEIFPGFAASEILYDGDKVIGVATNDIGLDKNGNKKDTFQRGMAIHAKVTLFAEGARGSLTEDLCKKLNLRDNKSPQTYGIGLKEIWEIDPKLHQQGKITHTIGWPLDDKTYGGSFIYHMENNQLAIGFVVGLDYQNPYLSPYEEFQRFKLHPKIKPLLLGGKRISYGARALNEGGLQAIPELVFAGGAIIGCAAGFLNVAKIKGTHNAMKSGMLAAETSVKFLKNEISDLKLYPDLIKKSWIYQELHEVRNIRPGFKYGLLPGLIYAFLDNYIFGGKAPWTFKHHSDHKALKPAKLFKKINYPKPDNIITFDRLTSVALTGTNHAENQPVHLTLKDGTVPTEVNLAIYDGPEQRYCPAAVYEFIEQDGVRKLQINSQNCIHCKTCDIKDPTQNIKWVCPEGGGGPRYPNM